MRSQPKQHVVQKAFITKAREILAQAQKGDWQEEAGKQTHHSE